MDKVCCVIIKDGIDGPRFLILKKNTWWKGWEFVRGEKREKETIVDAAIREINEETGLNITNVVAVPFTYNYNYMKGLEKRDAEVACFMAKCNDDNVVLSKEHSHYKWVDFRTAMMLLEFDEQKKLLNFINSNLL